MLLLLNCCSSLYIFYELIYFLVLYMHMLHYSHILTLFSPPFTRLLCSLLLISSFQTFLCLCFEVFLFCEPLSCPLSRWACLGLWTGAQGTYHCIHLWRYWPFALTRDFNSQEVPREGPGRSHNSRSPSLKDVERLSLVNTLYWQLQQL